MILSDLQHYLVEQRRASLTQLETKFGIDAAALRGMLSILVRKGRVKKMPPADRCHDCEICAQESLEFYESVQGTRAKSEEKEQNTVLERT